MSFSAIVLVFFFACPTVWAELNCSDSARSEDIFIDGKALTECRDGKPYVSRCIVMYFNYFEFEFVNYSDIGRYGSPYARMMRNKTYSSPTEECNDFNKSDINEDRITRGSLATILFDLPREANIILRKGYEVIDYRNFTRKLQGINCAKAYGRRKVIHIESNSLLDCDPEKELPKFEKCILKMGGFDSKHIDAFNDLNMLTDNPYFEKTLEGVRNPIDFCKSLQPHYDKVVEILGRDRIKSDNFNGIIKHHDDKPIFDDMTVIDKDHTDYFTLPARNEEFQLSCDNEKERGRKYVINNKVVIQCQYNTEKDKYEEVMTECIVNRQQDEITVVKTEDFPTLRKYHRTYNGYLNVSDRLFCYEEHATNSYYVLKGVDFWGSYPDIEMDKNILHTVKLDDFNRANPLMAWIFIPNYGWIRSTW